MNERLKEVLQKLLTAVPVISVISLAVLALVGSEFAAFTPFVNTVNAREYGSQDEKKDDDDDDDEPRSAYNSEEGRWENSLEGRLHSDTNVASFTLESSGMNGGASIGGGVGGIFGNTLGSQARKVTGCSRDNGEASYFRASKEVGPVAEGVLKGAALSNGYIAGGFFDGEVGIYRAGTMTACSSLNGTYDFDLYVNPPLPGYRNEVMILLPDGTTKLLDESVVDKSYYYKDVATNQWNGQGRFVVRTPYPKAVYMLVQVPENK